MSIFSSPKHQPPTPADALQQGMSKTKESLLARLARTVAGKSKIDDDLLDDLEETLIGADVGVATTLEIIERLRRRVAKDKYVNINELQVILREEIMAMLCDADGNDASSSDGGSITNAAATPYVILVVGVNGAGKTTTIGKLAARFVSQGKKVYIGAADTFRAAAIEQLEVWAQRAGAVLVKQHTGADPAAVAFDTMSKAKNNAADVVIIDTAGRLHNKITLMNELTKIRNVLGKVVPDAPHETLLVLDGSTGQNALRQAEEFTKATQVSALAITKLDGTANGGVVIGISAQMKTPVKYIGIGERTEDLQLFDRQRFVETLLES
jgi:fused signal recognition particle receptor